MAVRLIGDILREIRGRGYSGIAGGRGAGSHAASGIAVDKPRGGRHKGRR